MMAEYIEREMLTQYYVIRDKNTGLYFRGKGVNRWGKHYNQATIYRVKGTAEHTIKEIAWRGAEQAEIVPIRIIETTADVVEVVRCKNCEHSEMCFPCKAFGLEAPPVYVCCLGHRNREVLPNDYCSCGKKMNGVTDTNVGCKMDGKGADNG